MSPSSPWPRSVPPVRGTPDLQLPADALHQLCAAYPELPAHLVASSLDAAARAACLLTPGASASGDAAELTLTFARDRLEALQRRRQDPGRP